MLRGPRHVEGHDEGAGLLAFDGLRIMDQLAARMALVDASAFFDLSNPAPVRDERFEAVAALGQSVLHVLSRVPVEQVRSLAVGPPGTASNRLGGLFIAGLGLDAALSPADGETADALLAQR